jgi:hypothetical protein
MNRFPKTDTSLHEPNSQEAPLGAADHTLLTADEVAAILRVPRSWVYSHLSLLPVVRVGRYVRFRRRGIDRMANGFDDSDGGPCV